VRCHAQPRQKEAAGERSAAADVDDDQMMRNSNDADAAEEQMSPISVHEGVDDDGDSVDEPPTAAWQLTLNEATAAEAHEVDWKVVETAVQQWNDDGVTRRWSEKAVALVESGDEQYKQRVFKRYEKFLRALATYLNKFWTFIKDLAVPMIIQRIWKEGKDGHPSADIVKQGEKGFTSAMQNRSVNIMCPAQETGKLYSDRRLLTSLWLKSPYRNDKRTITFNPKSDVGGSDFNLWAGFACTRERAAKEIATRHAGVAADLVWQVVDQIPGGTDERLQLRRQVEVPAVTWQEDAKVFTDHIEQIWCQGDAELSNYVLNWLAHLLQFPEKKLGVALLVRGDHGAGKGVLMMLMREIIGRAHFSHFINLAEMTGQYNGEFLERCILGVVDEVHTNKEFDMSKVKALVTEDTHRVEQKYMAPYKIDSFANFIFLSNSAHMMKIEAGERRFLVLEVSGRYAGTETDESRRYFQKLLAISTGGRASLVAHFLYTRDISNFRSRSLPETFATMQQKLLSLNDVQRWWIRCLRNGEVPCPNSFNGAANKPGEATPWTLWRHKAELHQEYKKWCTDVGVHAAEDNSFWPMLKTCALFEDGRKTNSIKQKVHAVSFKPHSDNVQHFASKVLRISIDMFSSWLHNESRNVPAPPQNAPPYAPLFPVAAEAAGSAIDDRMQAQDGDAREDGYNAFEADEDAAGASAS